MRRIPWWALASAGAAPVLLIGGFDARPDAATAELRPDPRHHQCPRRGRGHRSLDHDHRTGRVGRLSPDHRGGPTTSAGRRARVVLGVGGGATVLVATFPQPAHGNSVAHTVAATVAFIALGTWPVLSVDGAGGAPLLRGRVSVVRLRRAPRPRRVVRGRAPWRSARTRRARRGERPGPVAAGGRDHHPPGVHAPYARPTWVTGEWVRQDVGRGRYLALTPRPGCAHSRWRRWRRWRRRAASRRRPAIRAPTGGP